MNLFDRHYPTTRIALALLVAGMHIYLLAAALIHKTYLIDDSVQYMTLAENLSEHGVFSQSYAAPFVPDMQRVPGYPILLILTGGSIPVLLILQHLLVLATAFVLYKILRFRLRPAYARLGAWLYALMPYPAIFASYVLSETLFIFLLVTAIWLYLRHFPKRNIRDLAISFILMAAAAYVRPIAMPLMLLAIIPVAIHHLRKRSFLTPTIALFLSLFLLSPWLLRNHGLSGRYTFNSMGDMGMLHGRLGGLEAWRQGKGVDEHELYMAGDSIAAEEFGLPNLRIYYGEKQSHETELYRKGVSGLTFSFFLAHPLDAEGFQLACYWAMIKGVGYGWARSLTLSKGAAYGLAGLQGLCNLIMYVGIIIAIWRFRGWKKDEWILFAGIFIILLISAAAWADGRYRVVADPLMLLLGLFALSRGRRGMAADRS